MTRIEGLLAVSLHSKNDNNYCPHHSRTREAFAAGQVLVRGVPRVTVGARRQKLVQACPAQRHALLHWQPGLNWRQVFALGGHGHGHSLGLGYGLGHRWRLTVVQ